MRALVLALCLLALPARAQIAEDKPNGLPPAVDVTLLVAAEALIVADLMQTFDIKNHSRLYETNPFLGTHPSDMKILLVGSASMAGVAALWAVIPKRFRFVVPVVVLSVEAIAVFNNAQHGLAFRTPF